MLRHDPNLELLLFRLDVDRRQRRAELLAPPGDGRHRPTRRLTRRTRRRLPGGHEPTCVS
jgi:hypothetical protein